MVLGVTKSKEQKPLQREDVERVRAQVHEFIDKVDVKTVPTSTEGSVVSSLHAGVDALVDSFAFVAVPEARKAALDDLARHPGAAIALGLGVAASFAAPLAGEMLTRVFPELEEILAKTDLFAVDKFRWRADVTTEETAALLRTGKLIRLGLEKASDRARVVLIDVENGRVAIGWEKYGEGTAEDMTLSWLGRKEAAPILAKLPLPPPPRVPKGAEDEKIPGTRVRSKARARSTPKTVLNSTEWKLLERLAGLGPGSVLKASWMRGAKVHAEFSAEGGESIRMVEKGGFFLVRVVKETGDLLLTALEPDVARRMGLFLAKALSRR